MHPNTICLLATLRYEELDALNARERLARQAVAASPVRPGAVARARIWAGTCLIAVGTRIRGSAIASEMAKLGRLNQAANA